MTEENSCTVEIVADNAWCLPLGERYPAVIRFGETSLEKRNLTGIEVKIDCFLPLAAVRVVDRYEGCEEEEEGGD